jgi:hypothetical protein
VSGVGFARKPLYALNYGIWENCINFPAAILKDGSKNYSDHILVMDRQRYFSAHRSRQYWAPLEFMNEWRPHQLKALASEKYDLGFDAYSGRNRTLRALDSHPANMHPESALFHPGNLCRAASDDGPRLSP